MVNFAFKMMNFALQMVNFVFKTMMFVLQMSNCALNKVNPITHKFVGGLTPAFEALDEWAAQRKAHCDAADGADEWTGRSKQLLIHSVCIHSSIIFARLRL